MTRTHTKCLIQLLRNTLLEKNRKKFEKSTDMAIVMSLQNLQNFSVEGANLCLGGAEYAPAIKFVDADYIWVRRIKDDNSCTN